MSETEFITEIEDITNCFLIHKNNSTGYRECFGQFKSRTEDKIVYCIIISIGAGNTKTVTINRMDKYNAGLGLNIKKFIMDSRDCEFEIISNRVFLPILEDSVRFD